MSAPDHPTVSTSQPAVAAPSMSDAIAQELLALQDELEHQADELRHVAVADDTNVAQVQASEQVVVSALRQMATAMATTGNASSQGATAGQATQDSAATVQAPVAEDLKSLDEAERSVANSISGSAKGRP